MLIMPSFKKRLIVEQFHHNGTWFKNIYFCFILLFTSSSPCRKDQFAVSYFSTSLIVLIQGLQLGDPAPLIGLLLWNCRHFMYFGTPYDGLYGEAQPEWGTFLQASGIWKGRGFTSEYIKGLGNLSFGLWKGLKGPNRWILGLYKVEKKLYFCDWFLLKRQCIYRS